MRYWAKDRITRGSIYDLPSQVSAAHHSYATDKDQASMRPFQLAVYHRFVPHIVSSVPIALMDGPVTSNYCVGRLARDDDHQSLTGGITENALSVAEHLGFSKTDIDIETVADGEKLTKSKHEASQLETFALRGISHNFFLI